jgi:hypothetical protein
MLTIRAQLPPLGLTPAPHQTRDTQQRLRHLASWFAKTVYGRVLDYQALGSS